MSVKALAGVIGQRETAVIAAVVDEIVAKPKDSLILRLLPIVNYPEEIIYHEKVTGFGGLLAERNIGEPGPTTDVSSSQTFEFKGGAYQETKRFTERDIRSLRRLGEMGKRGATGLTAGALDWLTRAGQGLNTKLLNRLNYMGWNTLLTGVFTFKGVSKANFNYPGANTVQAASDWSVPASSTPFTDLQNIINTNATFMKYTILEFVVNPVTAAVMLQSQEARVVIQNNSAAIGDINKVAQILYPGLPQIVICKDAWQDEGKTAGQITHGNTQYFLPNYFVLPVPDFSGTQYGQYGEIQMLNNINDPSATLEQPAVGIYTFLDEEGLKQRKAPFVEVTAGFNGGPNIMRSNDVLIIKTKAGI